MIKEIFEEMSDGDINKILKQLTMQENFLDKEITILNSEAKFLIKNYKWYKIWTHKKIASNRTHIINLQKELDRVITVKREYQNELIRRASCKK